MALSTFAELKASLADWSDRTDTTDQIVDFITLAEGEMNAELRTRKNTAVATVVIDTNGDAPVPAGFLSSRTLRLSASPNCDLESVSIDRLSELRASSTTAGNPQVYAELGENLVFWPAPSANTNAVCNYYRTIPALTASNTTNWVLSSYPNAYLNGALAEAFSYHDDKNNEARYRAKFAVFLDKINRREGVEVMGDSVTMLMEAATP